MSGPVTPGEGGVQGLKERNRDAMIGGFARHGGDPPALLAELDARLAALPPGSNEQPSIWNRIYLERLPPLSALFVGGETPFGQWEVIDFLAACYPTVGESLARIGRYFGLIKESVEFVVECDAGGLPFVEFRHRLDVRDEFFDEYTTGIFLAHFRALSRADLRLAAAHSVRERPRDADLRARIAAYLGCEPTYGARYSRMVFTRADWEAPLIAANPRLRVTLEAHASELVAELTRTKGLGERVRAVLLPLLRDGEPRIADVAQRLGMTARTLQRRLQDESLGFAALVDDARLQLARRYLADEGLTIAEVSYALGYSEPSAFARAFKRLAGAAPLEFREASRRPPQ